MDSSRHSKKDPKTLKELQESSKKDKKSLQEVVDKFKEVGDYNGMNENFEIGSERENSENFFAQLNKDITRSQEP